MERMIHDDAVLARLIQAQGGLSDQEMADRLGVSRPHWSRMKNGHRGLSRDVLMRAVMAFPEIHVVAVGEIKAAARSAS